MKIFLAPMIVFLAIGVAAGQSRITDEEYKIYGLVLTEFFREGNRRHPDNPETHVVIASKTIAVDPKTVTKERSSLYRSFSNRNNSQATVEPRFAARFSYAIADEQEILSWVEQDRAEYEAEQEQLRRDRKQLNGGPCGFAWKRFYSRFPGSFGYYQLSRIGFSRDHRWAYLEIEGKGSTWGESASYWVRWTKRGWETRKAGGGFWEC